MEILQSFIGLRDFVKGKIDERELTEIDPLIKSVRLNNKNRAQSQIILSPDSVEKFGKMIGLSDNDIFFYEGINNPYNLYEVFDSYYAENDFKEGWGIWYDLDDDNINLLNEIARYYLPSRLDLDSEESKGDFAKKLFKHFPREMDEIMNDWAHEKNIEVQQVADKYCEKEISDALNEFGLEKYGLDGIKTTVADLIGLYLQFGIPHVSLQKLIRVVFESKDYRLGGWDEDRFEYQDSSVFDSFSFNKSAERNLDKIIEKMSEEGEPQEFKKYIQMVDRISKKFPIGKWFTVPKDDNYTFKITDYEKEGLLINLRIQVVGTNKQKDFKMTEEGLNRLLYQPELFKLEL